MPVVGAHPPALSALTATLRGRIANGLKLPPVRMRGVRSFLETGGYQAIFSVATLSFKRRHK